PPAHTSSRGPTTDTIALVCFGGLFRRPHYWCSVHPVPLGAATGMCRSPEFLAAASKLSAASRLNRPRHFFGKCYQHSSLEFAHATINAMIREESHENPILCCVCDARGLRTWRGRGSRASRPSQAARLSGGRNRCLGPGNVFEGLRSKSPSRDQG